MLGRRAFVRATGALLAGAVTGLAGCGGGEDPARGATPVSHVPLARTPELGADNAVVGAIRITLRTGTVNGAGTDNPVLVWFDNQRQEISRAPVQDFAPGASVEAVLTGTGLPRTLGALRRSSIVLTLHLDRASIGASWYCDLARVEVRLEGEEDYDRYLEVRDLGWLSQAEPPRRSPAYALQ